MYNMGRLAKHVKVFDTDTGEIVKEGVNYGGLNEAGFMLVYADAFMQMAQEIPNYVTWKVFASLASKQEYEGGLKTTKQAISDELGITYPNILKAFKWLKEHAYVKEYKERGVTTFLLNPTVTTCGKKQLTEKKKRLWESLP